MHFKFYHENHVGNLNQNSTDSLMLELYRFITQVDLHYLKFIDNNRDFRNIPIYANEGRIIERNTDQSVFSLRLPLTLRNSAGMWVI